MTTTSPIDIATPSRNASSSPSSQGTKSGTRFNSNTGVDDSRTSAIMSASQFTQNGERQRQESFVSAKPISMNNPRNLDPRPRRESLAGSLVGGMSWGGVSVGSWIRDDIIMAGTSPFPYQSPSYHSSSYLPKLEANFMRDFSCCGHTLPTLHDLLQHYEECHAQQTPQSLRTAAAQQQVRDQQQPNSKAAIASQAANSVQQQAQQQRQQQQQRSQNGGFNTNKPAGGISTLTGGIQQMRRQQSNPSTPTQKSAQPSGGDDMDGVEDMEMDDPVGPMDPVDGSANRPVQPAQQSMFGQQQRPNNITNTGGMLHQGLRTPAELDDDFNTMNMDMNNIGNMNMNTNNMNFPYGFGNDLGLELCIDEPAKRLFSPNGGFGNQKALQQQFAQFGLGNGQFANNDDLVRRLRQQQMMQMQGFGNGSAAMMMGGEEHKPFRCPVIGCEKAYKNQNGLKYHKTHGHQTQQLHENGDGTFSIVNPETSAPYPGTLGMEKEKPYKCDVCGKRYKNLNGLKYHKQHSPPCNPEMKLNGHLQAAGLSNINGGINVNVPGLPGIGEEGML
ncbi:hypothetical protein O988_04630 [Pseudogymnoascus sp. VKM F-3808]|nr:hypothetical protein V490_03065 [Pseudogymnoascus sp. VKM F-3557]KFX97857.1 hypothetical protein O988_04630 [Pseudogymnoascus sp. VKM F-3808]KFY43130.1 hypothetical protein V495_04164 [Pseudogymnoascus sp. VKM F-4514 (FW-929)]KFY60227.1 hypothetical protein V497_03799 [Pseudogymnoascus sp. VKM F-4516 (FW-969)]